MLLQAKPDKWRGDEGGPNRGEWPSEVVSKLAEMVMGLTCYDDDDRMPLTQTLSRSSNRSRSPRASRPSLTESGRSTRHAANGGSARVHVLHDALRQVRFRMRPQRRRIKCFDDIKQKAIDAAAIVADEPRHSGARGGGKNATIQCPTCREPIGDELAEKGDKVGNAPTFVKQAKKPQERGGRGGRGRSASGRGR